MHFTTAPTRTKDVSHIIAIIAIALLFIGFLFNKVVNNIGFGFAGLYTLMHLKSIKWLFFKPWMWSFIGMALLPFLSDLIHEHIFFFEERGVTKLLLLLFPAFIFSLRPNSRWILNINFFIIFMMLISTVYSLYFYVGSVPEIVKDYNVSKVLPVLALKDHIRISWVTVITIFLAAYNLMNYNLKWTKILLVIYILLQITFIHILGSKTGLVTFYGGVIVLATITFVQQKKWLYLLGVYLGLATLGSIAYQVLPTLKKRIEYIQWDYQHYSKGQYKSGLSDGTRVASIMAGIDVAKNNSLMGVGFSNLKNKVDIWYTNNLPEMKSEERFLPISQVIVYWASGGLIALIIILLHMVLPFTIPYLKSNIWFMSFFIPLCAALFYETHLETQFGIFCYCFFISWFWYLAHYDTKFNKKQGLA